MEAGFSKAVAEELYNKCDQDRDGSFVDSESVLKLSPLGRAKVPFA